MAIKLMVVRANFLRFCLLPWAIISLSLPAGAANMNSPGHAQAFVAQALANELHAAQDTDHPMRYQLRKASPRLTSTKEIYETRNGAVARLVAINDEPLSPAAEQKEQARLDGLLRDPSRQEHRKQAEEADSGRALKILRLLPQAFVYSYAGSQPGPNGEIDKFTFIPNPKFDPPDLETRVLTAMYGEIWVDAAHERVTHLEGHLKQNVDFGWGLLGRLYKGGWIVIEQANVGENQWRIVRLKMQMSGRVLFKTRQFDVLQEATRFAPLPAGITYRQAIFLMRKDP